MAIGGGGADHVPHTSRVAAWRVPVRSQPLGVGSSARLGQQRLQRVRGRVYTDQRIAQQAALTVRHLTEVVWQGSFVNHVASTGGVASMRPCGLPLAVVGPLLRSCALLCW